MSSGISAVTPWAASKAALRRSVRRLLRLSRSPKRTKGETPACLMCPGAAFQARIPHRPSSTLSSPSAFARRSAASTPFSNGTTRVSGPTRGRIASAASITCHALTATMTASTTPTSHGSSLAFTVPRCRSPSMLETLRPSRRIAARCSPRAMKVTS
ncbi:hypothetical protein Q671_06580 [Halomonas sp. PBN3]|nr:hypothetical protein Q671_06580 [Halomonas sp. PBN3]